MITAAGLGTPECVSVSMVSKSDAQAVPQDVLRSPSGQRAQ